MTVSKIKAVICPYCGHTQHLAESCRSCGGRFDADSRKATRQEMGAWFVRDPAKPFRPGCSRATIRRLVERGKVDKYTILRGPTTRQFWTVARRVPGVAHLLGYCHACAVPVDPGDEACPSCRASFVFDDDRDRLGVDSNGAAESDGDGFSIADLLRPESLRPPRGRQLSAFVDDVVEPDEPAIDRRHESLRPPRNPLMDPAPTSGDDAIGRLTLETLERALRRTVIRQQRTIQSLGVLVALLAIIVVWAIVARGMPSTPHGDGASVVSPDTAGSEVPSGDAGETPSTPTTETEPPSDPIAGPTETIGAAEAAIESFDPAAFESIDGARAALGDLDDRLAELSAAMSVDDPRRADVASLRDRVDRLLAELEVADFFAEFDEDDAER